MIDKRRFVTMTGIALVAAILVCVMATEARADEMRGRWRFDVQIGGVSPGGEIRSQSGNVTTLIQFDNEIVIRDPRPDTTSLNSTQNQGDGRIELHASYGIASFKRSELLLDLGIGYQESTIENLEMSHAFDAADTTASPLPSGTPPSAPYGTPGCESRLASAPNFTILETDLGGCTWFSDRLRVLAPGDLDTPTRTEYPDSTTSSAPVTQFQTELVGAGKVKSVPITIDALWRFRPTKRFNPYVGAGVGYMVVDFQESDRFQQVADQLAGSRVAYVNGPPDATSLGARDLDEVSIEVADSNGDGTNEIRATSLGHLMKRPEVDAPDTFFGQLRGGVEFQFARRWSLFLDGKFSWAAKNITITADGLEKFGAPTPNVTGLDPAPDGDLDPQVFPNGGRPVYVMQGGLRQPAYDPVNGQLIESNSGEFGQPGEYYINGGQLKHGGWAFMTGVRFSL